MLGTLGYLLELTVSIYFFCVVLLFMINVCEFMPLTSHHQPEEVEKVTRVISSAALGIHHDSSPQKKSGAADWVNIQKKRAEDSKSWEKKHPKDPSKGEKKVELAPPPYGVSEPKKAAEKEQSPGAPAENHQAQDSPANGGTATATDDGTAGTTPADDGTAAPLTDDGATTAPTDDATPTAPDNGAVPPDEPQANDGPAPD